MTLMQSLPSLLPLAITPYSQVAVTDIDGDTLSEVVVLNSDILHLGIAHQFLFSDMTPPGWSEYTTQTWSQFTNPNWITTWAANMQGTAAGACTVLMGDQMLVADFDGDGTDEIFLYNIYRPWWRIAKWNAATGQLNVICQCAGTPQWTIQPYDQYFVFPNPNGQTGAGILLFNTQTLAIAVLLFSGGVFSVSPAVTGGGVDGFNFQAAGSSSLPTRFIGGHFVQAGQGAFLVFNSNSIWVGVTCLTWDGQAFHASSGQSHQVGGWSLGSGDQIQAADLDGDGVDELFFFSAGDGFLGVWKFNGNASPPQWECPVCTKSVNGLSIGGQDQYLATVLPWQPGKPHASIVAYGQQQPQIGVLNCTDLQAGFTFQPGSLGTDWQVTSNDRYFAAPLTALAEPRLIVASQQSGSLRMGAINTSTSGMSVASSCALPVPGWTPTYLATTAPVTESFTPFTGEQLDIYHYISKLLTLKATDDLRSIYDAPDYQDLIGGYVSTLTVESAVPAGKPWHPDNWAAVRKILLGECNAVALVYGIYKSLGKLASSLNHQQTIDLAQVQSNIQLPPPSDAATIYSYWLAQVAVAALWGIGAGVGLFLEVAEVASRVGVCCSVGASLLGSLFGELVPPDAPPPKVAYGQIKTQMAVTFANTAITQCETPSEILKDPIKLQIAGQLANTTWNMKHAVTPTTMAAVAQADRLAFYQQLLPFLFTIGEELNAPRSSLVGPNCQVGVQVNVELPEWNIYWLYAPPDTNPSAALVSDLTALGVGEQMLLGAGQWAAIPHKIWPV